MDKHITWWQYKDTALVEVPNNTTYNDVKDDPLKLSTWLVEELRYCKEVNARNWMEKSGVRTGPYSPLQAFIDAY